MLPIDNNPVEMRSARSLPAISRGSFVKTKLLLWGYFLMWVGGVLFLYSEWSKLSPFVKYPLAIIEGVFAPELGIFSALFEGYEKFRERINKII